MKKSDNDINSADTQCFLRCCGNELSIFDAWITRCLICGKGYRTEFVVYEYAPEEIDSGIEEEKDYRSKIVKGRG